MAPTKELAEAQEQEKRRWYTMYVTHEEGQGLVEYALIIFLIAILLVVVLGLLGGTIGSVFSSVQLGLATGT
jgi:pilus assembly protein Flp/PilA